MANEERENNSGDEKEEISTAEIHADREQTICELKSSTFGYVFENFYVCEEDKLRCKKCKKNGKHIKKHETVYLCERCNEFVCHLCFAKGRFLLPGPNSIYSCQY